MVTLIRPHCPDPSCHKVLRMNPHDHKERRSHQRFKASKYDRHFLCVPCHKWLKPNEAVTKVNGKWAPYLATHDLHAKGGA